MQCVCACVRVCVCACVSYIYLCLCVCASKTLHIHIMYITNCIIMMYIIYMRACHDDMNYPPAVSATRHPYCAHSPAGGGARCGPHDRRKIQTRLRSLRAWSGALAPCVLRQWHVLCCPQRAPMRPRSRVRMRPSAYLPFLDPCRERHLIINSMTGSCSRLVQPTRSCGARHLPAATGHSWSNEWYEHLF